MAVKYLILVFVIAITAVASQNVDDALDSLPPEIKGKLSDDKAQELKNKTTQAFQQKCDKNGGPGTYSNVETSFTSFVTCIQSLVNQKQLQAEIDEASPNGKVDEVFKKYCAKTPSFKNCFKNMTEAARPCFNDDEKKHLRTVYNITEQLAEFVCFKEGDRIALFIAEGGPACIQERQEYIQGCVNATFGGDFKVDAKNFSVDTIPTIAFGEKECGQLSQLQKCVVEELEKCSQPTSANIVESLFKFARKATPCKDTQLKANSAVSNALATATAAIVAITYIF